MPRSSESVAALACALATSPSTVRRTRPHKSGSQEAANGSENESDVCDEPGVALLPVLSLTVPPELPKWERVADALTESVGK